MIELRQVSKRYGPVRAVKDLSFQVARGEIFGFIGPNGAGKTTTIRMMAGVILPTTGDIVIGGLLLRTDPVKAKRIIGFIPDRPFLYEKLTGMEFLRFIADLYGVAPAVMKERAEAYLRSFGLWDWAHYLIASYSQGMKQRLIIAAALLHDPAVLIVDEPMVGLDPAGIRQVKDLLRQWARQGKTIFLSTHTLTVAEDLCDRIGIIHRGSLLALGTTRELVRRTGTEAAGLEDIFLKLTEGEEAI